MKKNTVVIVVVLLVVSTVIACKSKSSTSNEEAKTILVQVFEDASVELLEQDYSAYELRKEKVVSRPMRIYLFTYNTQKIEEKELISQLKTSQWVQEAQSNKNVQTRN
ncbi:MAG: hypothetical protein AAFP76_14060 [Bacteroidota bacterium]